MVINSDNGTASQTPFTPNSMGRVSNPIVIKQNVLKKEIIAETFPLDKAVKIAEEKILNPQNKKLIGKIKNPFLAISYTSLPAGENTLTRRSPKNIDIMKTNIDIKPMKVILLLIKVFNLL